MKNILALIAAPALLAFAAQTAIAETVTTTTTITVVRADPGFNPPSSCPFSGTGCTVTVTTTTQSANLAVLPSGGYSFTVPVLPMSITVARAEGPVTVPAENRSIIFPPGSAFQILSSLAYPALVGRIVDVSGVATNALGGFNTLFIP